MDQRNSRWKRTISNSTKDQAFAWYTSHRVASWYDIYGYSCSSISRSLLGGGLDDGLIMRKDARNYIDDSFRERWCHSDGKYFHNYPRQVDLPELRDMARANFNTLGRSSIRYCSSRRVDSDGDGWGWENGASCEVWTGVPWCRSASSDSDGDGWGWENRASCRVR